MGGGSGRAVFNQRADHWKLRRDLWVEKQASGKCILVNLVYMRMVSAAEGTLANLSRHHREDKDSPSDQATFSCQINMLRLQK